MKKLFALFLLLSVSFRSFADEGMWLPILLDQLNITDMKARGFKLTAADIYSINKSSMKDAVVQFGGGCTAEVISGEGLLLTNHHCGYGYVQSLSTMQNDILTNGFWAMNRSEEKPCPGLSVTFIVRMVDVTSLALKGVTDDMGESKRDSIIRVNNKAIETDSAKASGYGAFVRGFYNGNVFYLFITETFNDVRLVGVPPVSIGNFGGDTDNWAWPRHTGDFSMFRIYAGKDNKPAPYSAENVPFKPRHFFPISLKGVKENDFTMVYGFPGRTTEYLSSDAVDMVMNVSDPVKVAFRDTRLAIMKEEMRKNDTIFLQYTAKYNGAANSWKKWKGEVLGLNRNKAVDKKRDYEKTFTERVAKNPAWSSSYGNLLTEMNNSYIAVKPWQKAIDAMNEGPFSVELIRMAGNFSDLVAQSTAAKPDTAKFRKALAQARSGVDGSYKDYRLAVDKRIAVALFTQLQTTLEPSYLPAFYSTVLSKKEYNGSIQAYIDDVFAKSIFASKEKVNELLKNYTADKSSLITSDPAYMLWKDCSVHFNEKLKPAFDKLSSSLVRLNRMYMKAQREVMTDRKFYPDANSTLRVAYGNVKAYAPRDGMQYKWYTTIDGIMEKEDPKNPDFKVAPKLKELYDAKNFGDYIDKTDGKLHTCFIATNHTTGGNSGSPVLDAKGNLIGTNFDRVWEGTMSDLMFDSNLCRNITLDVRYTLFIVDKLGGAGYLLNEMKIIR